MKKTISSFSFVIFLIALTQLFLMIKKIELEQQPPTPEPVQASEAAPEWIPEEEDNTSALAPAPTHLSAFPDLHIPGPEDYVWEDNFWNSYHGPSELTGHADFLLPASLSPLWQIQAEAAVYGTPVYAEGLLFFANIQGGVFAVTREGDILWNVRVISGERSDGTTRYASFEAPMLYLEDRIFACDDSGFVVAFIAETGEEIWRRFLDISVLGSPNYQIRTGEDGSSEIFIYIIDQASGALHCLKGETGEVAWVSSTEVGRCDATPGVSGDFVVFGSCASALHVFSSRTGELLHDLELGNDSQVASGVALVDGKGLSGSRDGSLVLMDLNEGKRVWTTELSRDEIFSTPAVSGNWVVVGDEDGNLFAVHLVTGEIIWKTQLDGPIQSPVILRDKVAVSVDGLLYLLRLDTGETLWSYELSDEITSPCVAGKAIVVGSSDATVTAFAGNDEGDSFHD